MINVALLTTIRICSEWMAGSISFVFLYCPICLRSNEKEGMMEGRKECWMDLGIVNKSVLQYGGRIL